MEQKMAFIWLGIALLMGILEATTAQLVSIWFVAGAICAAVTSVFTDNLYIQISVFIFVSLAALLITRPIVKKVTKFKKVKTNADRYVGKVGIVTEEINNSLGKGLVNIEGSIWTARSVFSEKTIPVSTKVLIERIEGVKVLVSPVKEEAIK